MQRLTISIDDELAEEFEALVKSRGYDNRSEAFRDLVRGELRQHRVQAHPEAACVATLSYVYDHHERTLAKRLMDAQHDHHDLTVSSTHAHLSHSMCIETVILRGQVGPVSAFAQSILTERGVCDGQLHLIPLE